MYPETYNIHGYSIVFGDVGFFGIGSGNIGLFEIGEKDVKKILKKAAKGVEKSKGKIMITHVPPYGTKLDNLGWTRAGSKSIREIIEDVQPDYCLCGHIHETFGKEDKIGKTKVINVGRKGKIITIRSKEGKGKAVKRKGKVGNRKGKA
jgi:Icc-related predicted phosphoesterase